MTRKTLAARVGIVPSTLNMQLKRGQLHAGAIAPIADVLGVSVHFLLTGEDDWMGLAAESFLEARRSLQEAAASLHHCQGIYLGEAG